MIDIRLAILACKVVRNARKLGLIKRPPLYAISRSDYARYTWLIYRDLKMLTK